MPQLDRPLIKQRAAELRSDVAKRRDAWLNNQVGKPLSVLAERDGTGYAPNFARVDVPEGTIAGTILSLTPTSLDKGLLR
jgi:threonylcarbamoyladenosine tRNA methylthiotransferase MtaB